MRWGRGITEAQIIEVIPGQAGRGAVPCSPKLLKASWQGWRVLCGVLASRLLGEALQKDIWILWFLGVGPLRNLGVLPSNSLRRKKGRRERGWGLGIAAPAPEQAQRTGCSCCLLGNQHLRGRGLSDIALESLYPSLLCPTLLLPVLPPWSTLKQRWGG